MTKQTLLFTTLLLTIPVAMVTLQGQSRPERVDDSDSTVQPESTSGAKQDQVPGYSEHQKKIRLILLLKNRTALIQHLLNESGDFGLARETASDLLAQFQKSPFENATESDFKVVKDFIEFEINSLIETLDSLEKIREQPAHPSALDKHLQIARAQIEGLMQLIPNLEDQLKTRPALLDVFIPEENSDANAASDESDMRAQLSELANRLTDAEKRLAEATANREDPFPVQSITVTGAVNQPQVITLGKDQKITIPQAIIMAGGFEPFSRKHIEVIRPKEKVYKFSEEEIMKSLAKGENIFYLRDGDIVKVDENTFSF